jgi:hypothetical protein
MPATLGQLVRDRAFHKIELQGDASLNIWYRPGALTERLNARLNEFVGRDPESLTGEEQNRSAIAMTDYLYAIVLEWDLLYPDKEVPDPEHPEQTIIIPGGPVPVTRDAMRDLPYDEQRFIVNELQDAARISKSNGSDLSETSPTSSQKADALATSLPSLPNGSE